MNPFVYLGEIRRDLIYAVRVLIKSPGFAAVGVISLGLGIGVTTATFSDVNALMLRLPPILILNAIATSTICSPASLPTCKACRSPSRPKAR